MLSLLGSRSYKLVLQRILDSNKACSTQVSQTLLGKVGCKPSKSSDSCGASPPSGGGGSGKAQHQITYKQYVAPCYKDHDHKNMELNRPMSPHLTIYAPTIPAVTSISQRISGVVLSFYAAMLSAGTLFLSNGVESYVSMIQSLDMSRPTILLLKLIIGTPFAYHYFFGIRFCIWNAGRWLNMKDVRNSVRPLLIAAGVTIFLFALL